MQSPESVRILVADDHPIFRNGLCTLLVAEPGFVVVGEAVDGAEAVRLVRSLQPDILLLDLAMPVASGMEVLAEVSRATPSVRTVIVTASIEKPDVVKAFQIGAAGVVLKTSPPHLVFKCIRSVMRGELWIGREAVSDLVQALRHYSGTVDQGNSARERFGLSPRELEITAAVVAGLSNKEIALKLRLSGDTVKHHLTRIFNKMGASNRLELALFAVHHRILDENGAAE
jgi:DNA-binding NarL/FixJ family response regulator